MMYEKCKYVYNCCGQYIAPTNAASKKQLKCPRCKKELTTPVKLPHIIIVKIQ